MNSGNYSANMVRPEGPQHIVPIAIGSTAHRTRELLAVNPKVNVPKCDNDKTQNHDIKTPIFVIINYK